VGGALPWGCGRGGGESGEATPDRGRAAAAAPIRPSFSSPIQTKPLHPHPCSFPRGNGIGIDLAAEGISADFKGRPLEVGKGVVRREGTDVAIVAYGSSVNDALVAAELLARSGVSATVVDARFCKPLDTDLLRRCAREHAAMVTVEEGSIGGFAAHVMQFLALDGLLDGGLRFRPMTLPDRYIDHGKYEDQLTWAGLTPSHIAATCLSALGKSKDASLTLSGISSH
jgi:1-deoxy-D-xylulose-5-phosphate synthase